VIHYEPPEAALLAERLRRDGFDAFPCMHIGTKAFRGVRENPPDAILIDLFRLPSYGRSLAVLLRGQKSTRAIPLVFLVGDPEKAERVRQTLPDAVYAPLDRIGAALKRAIARPPADPVVPKVHAPLLQKLQVTERSRVALVHAPEGFALPAPARTTRKAADADTVLTFVRTAAALGRELPSIAKAIRPGCRHWVVWPKRKAGAVSTLAMPAIQEMCQAFGLVGYKTCAIDETWSGMVLARRQTAR
jgi:hypothetical protein